MGHVASVERRTSDGKGFVPIREKEAVFPDEPLRLSVRNASFGSVFFKLTRGTRQGVVRVGEWSTNVGLLDGGYGAVDVSPLREEGVYLLSASVRPLFLLGEHRAYIDFRVSSGALFVPPEEEEPGPPFVGPAPFPPTSSPPTEPGFQLPALSREVRTVGFVVLGIVALYTLSQALGIVRVRK